MGSDVARLEDRTLLTVSLVKEVEEFKVWSRWLENFIFQVDDPTIAMKVERATERLKGQSLLTLTRNARFFFGSDRKRQRKLFF